MVSAHRGIDQMARSTFEHGTRARYVQGCRCAACRTANTTLYHARQRKSLEAVEGIEPPAPVPVTQQFTRPDGSVGTRVYRNGCPGPGGKGCPGSRHLRKNSVGGVCHECRHQLVWNGLVPATRARNRLKKLSERGVGYKAVAAACDVGTTTVAKILSGEKTKIRKRTYDAIMAVDQGAVADHALVPADRTWRMLKRLEEEYFTKARVARILGYRSRALQIGRNRVLARTELRVERLYRRVMG